MVATIKIHYENGKVIERTCVRTIIVHGDAHISWIHNNGSEEMVLPVDHIELSMSDEETAEYESMVDRLTR